MTAPLATTWTAVTADRDDTTDNGLIGSVYHLTHPERMNISDRKVWKFPNFAHVIQTGSTASDNYGYMNGTVQGDYFKMTVSANSGKRMDVSTDANGKYDVKGMELDYFGSGACYWHLENGLSRFSEYLKINVNLSVDGLGSMQFPTNEMAGLFVNISEDNEGSFTMYPARNSAGFTSFSNFEVTSKATEIIILKKGTENTSHGRFYNPKYNNSASGNYLDVRIARGGTNGNLGREYFLMNVENIFATDTYVKITDEDSGVIFNETLTDANTTINNNSGTALTAYSGQKVIPVLVRLLTVVKKTRKKINYIIRRKGFVSISVQDFDFNAPLTIGEMQVDANYDTTITAAVPGVSITGSTITITESITAQQLYNYYSIWNALPAQHANTVVLTISNGLLDLGSFALTIEDNVVLSKTTDITELNATTVTVQGRGATDLLYTNTDGTVGVNLSATGWDGNHQEHLICWLKSQGKNTRIPFVSTNSNIKATVPVYGKFNNLLANTDYYYIADGIGTKRSEIGEFNTGAFGLSLPPVQLVKIVDVEGDPLIPFVSTDASIEDLLIYDAANDLVQIRTPTDLTTLSGYDSATSTLTLTSANFPALIFKIDSLQSAIGALTKQYTMKIGTFSLAIEKDSVLKIAQHPDNPDGLIINLNAFQVKKDGDISNSQTHIDHSNGVILSNSGDPVVATVENDITVTGGFDDSSKTQTIFDELMLKLPSTTADLFKGDGSNVADIVDAILDIQLGKRSDGNDVNAGTLGEHWYDFYPPEVVRQLLETALDGTTNPTRYQPVAGTYGDGTLGNALRKVLEVDTTVSTLPNETKVRTIVNNASIT